MVLTGRRGRIRGTPGKVWGHVLVVVTWKMPLARSRWERAMLLYVPQRTRCPPLPPMRQSPMSGVLKWENPGLEEVGES